MGYRDANFKSMLTHEGEDEAYDITVYFTGYVGGDMVPYGSTYVEFPGGGPEEITEIEIDGVSISEADLAERLGVDAAEAVLKRAYDNAEEVE